MNMKTCSVWLLAALALTSANAHELPARKPGLWELTLRSERGASQRVQRVQQCTSRQAEAVMLLSVVPGQEDCHQVTAKRRGKVHEIRTVCYVHDQRVDAHVQLSGDLNSSYSGSYEVKFAQHGAVADSRALIEGRWLGACSQGQRPGDMVLPNGVTVNVVDDRKRAEAHDHSGHKH
jgi:hypothetical protein